MLLVSAALARLLLRDVEGRDQVNPLALYAGPFIIASSPILSIASVSGLETTIFAALLTSAVWQFLALATTAGSLRNIRQTCVAGLLAGLATWARPEGTAWVLGMAILASVVAKRNPNARRAVLLAIAIALSFFATLLIFRLITFGHLHPNTYYAKMGWTLSTRVADGLRYVREWIGLGTGGLMLLLSLPSLLLGNQHTRWPVLACFSLVVGHLLIVIYEGGDWIPHLRMFTPLLGVLAALVSTGLALVVLRLAPHRLYTLTAAAAIAVGLTFYIRQQPDFRRAFLEVQTRLYGWNDAHRALGRWIAEWHARRSDRNKPPLTVALMDIGHVGWESDVRIIDFAGLADPDWAHAIYRAKGRHVYPAQQLLERTKPEIIVMVSLSRPNDKEQEWWPGAEREIFRHPTFHQDYTRAGIYTHKDFPGDANFLHVYVRKELAKEAPPLVPPKARATPGP